MKRFDLTGRQFGRLTAISPAPHQQKMTTWYCQCACGMLHVARTSMLSNGTTTSCGCLRSEKLKELRTTHGQSKKNETGAYVSWTAMKWRCKTTRLPTFLYYGMRGITYCKRWESFDNFFKDMGPRPVGMSLDRRNGDLGYSKTNCRWVTPTEQSRNRRNVKAAHAHKAR